MALRIDTAVLRGELDSTERGRVRGRLWLMGREEPVILDLEGDPWRDVAGMKVSFVNPSPKAQESAGWLKGMQKGVVGDISVSRKVRVFTVSDETWLEAYREGRIEEVPTEWRNSLYLEWFSTEQGRCVVESADFELTMSDEPVWRMDEHEDGAQRLANMQAMRDFLAAIIQRKEPAERSDNDHDGGAEGDAEADAEGEAYEDLSEEAWEEHLKASDRLGDANLEALDKYGDCDDAINKMAFVMGWDHLIKERTDEGEGVDLEQSLLGEAGDDTEAEDDDDDDGNGWDDEDGSGDEDDDEGTDAAEEAKAAHPLRVFSYDLVVRLVEQLREAGLDDVRGEERDHPLDRFMANVMQISGKLAGALGGGRGDAEMEMSKGYTLAITKRCLNWANEALAAVEELTALEEFAGRAALIEGWRADLFKLREGITDLRREMRGE